jgi:hypothetical protein
VEPGDQHTDLLVLPPVVMAVPVTGYPYTAIKWVMLVVFAAPTACLCCRICIRLAAGTAFQQPFLQPNYINA